MEFARTLLKWVKSWVEDLFSQISDEVKALDKALDLKQPVGDYVLRNEIEDPPVTSVNGMTGDVKIEIPEIPDIPESMVTSVNGMTGDVKIEVIGRKGAYIGGEIFNDYATNVVYSYSHAEGRNTQATGHISHAEGVNTQATGETSHAEGSGNIASGKSSHAEGEWTAARGYGAHSEGLSTIAFSYGSHAEGNDSIAVGNTSHAEGRNTMAYGDYSHAEGYGHMDYNTMAIFGKAQTTTYTYTNSPRKPLKVGDVIVYNNVAAKITAIDETAKTFTVDKTLSLTAISEEYPYIYYFGARGDYSHIEGYCTQANGETSHAEGKYTIASGDCSHVQGKFNIEDTENKYAHIVGNGTGSDIANRSNAHTLDWEGNAWYAGTIESKAFILSSSTEGSTKRFKIIIDDNGALTTTEIVEETT